MNILQIMIKSISWSLSYGGLRRWKKQKLPTFLSSCQLYFLKIVKISVFEYIKDNRNKIRRANVYVATYQVLFSLFLF